MASTYDDLRAVFINCTLKRSPEVSNTQGLADLSIGIMRKQGVDVDVIRAVDHDIATGVWPDMTEHGWPVDEWPASTRAVDRSTDRSRSTCSTMPGRRTLMTTSRPLFSNARCVCAIEAVAITFAPRAFAIWIAKLPTPPEPP